MSDKVIVFASYVPNAGEEDTVQGVLHAGMVGMVEMSLGVP